MSEPTGGETAPSPAPIVNDSTTTSGTPAQPETAAPPPAPPSKDAKTTEAAAGPTKLSAAELKKQKQAEKQARRAQAKSSGPPAPQKGPSNKEGAKSQKESKQSSKDDKSKSLPMRRRNSQPSVVTLKETKKESRKESKKDSRQPGLFFGHLYNQPRQHSIVGATKEVHPAILALGLQYSSYIVCGSTARMVAMLLAFKAVIDSYQTPVGTSLARHLTSHHLSPQIDYLRSCRPLSISMGNAIRWLKDIIIKIDPSTPEAEAKRDLISEIDDFIRDRVTAADKLIIDHAVKKIENGDVILTYASSSIVEKTLVHTHKAGIKFSVIVVDSKPLFEGKQLARKLAHHGIPVKYFLVTGATHAVKQANKVFLGAHAMMSNGRLYSRVGTAIISMLAHAQSLPVIVLCESVKFTERVALDSIVGNEVAPSEEVLSEGERQELLPLKPHLPAGLLTKLGESTDKAGVEKANSSGEVLKWIEASDNLQMLQVLYDVTPAEYINMVITEYGSLPPSSVPVVHRLSMDKQETRK
ncbi:IF-2B-domain-containing protein [Aaosphaeria arxii CBS 175.79]|uniref:Translation initiation factor eIF2B subunit delta n=1 Tax=Aaosphaeria arxii CBS 175.79 TaxID=1450172 RepID=A0A6A5XER0_9PLEO|nr:IF-2B-domain-containing protein [Aaosphaeria arxii CBS 175.79]KAF2011369.1 IF-2B-domain-containing protein [Aaosphaeria arxii CBS 175.79]